MHRSVAVGRMLPVEVSGLFDGLAREPWRHGVRWCVLRLLDAPAGWTPHIRG
jgi:hypothetical protein